MEVAMNKWGRVVIFEKAFLEKNWEYRVAYCQEMQQVFCLAFVDKLL